MVAPPRKNRMNNSSGSSTKKFGQFFGPINRTISFKTPSMSKQVGYDTEIYVNNKSPQPRQSRPRKLRRSRKQITTEREWMEFQLQENDDHLDELEKRISGLGAKLSWSSK